MNAALQASAFWVTAAGEGKLLGETLAEPGPHEVLVRTLYSAVSRGTEALVFRGEVPPSEHARMRAPFQQGDFPAPVKYGYINVGEVEQGPESLIGKPVFCLYPHQTRYVVAADAVTPIPPGVPARRAVLAANMETAVNALWDLAPRIGDRVAVVGGGALGCLCARLATQIPGCRVELVDANPRRAEIAAELGVAFAVPDAATLDADAVIHCSGSGPGLASALRLAGFEARVLELSWYGARAVALPLGEAFHAKRLQLISSQVGSVSAAQRARWSHRRRLSLALRLLEDPVFDALITDESPFDALPEVLAELSKGPGETICHRIAYP
jgi:2-desacetyl-2-hydroxyethyl bacteriochlorophyllide A dehydrogenase